MKNQLAVVSAMLAACSGDDGSALPPGSASIGASGGSVELQDGAKLDIPSGALHENVTIAITVSSTSIADAVGSVYKFEPDGLSFDAPVTVTMPVATDSSDLRVYWSKASGTGFDMLATMAVGGGVTAPITHFSEGYVGPVSGEQPVATHYPYVVDSMLLPNTNQKAKDFGLDLDGNNVVDNQLGMVFGTLAVMGTDVTIANAGGIASGDVHNHIDLLTTDFASAQNAGFTTFVDTAPTEASLPGNFVSGTLEAGPGHLPLQLELVASRPIVLNLVGARVKTAGSASALTSGIIAGGVTQSDVNGKIVPELAVVYTSVEQAGCSGGSGGCTCTSGTTAASVHATLDTDDNCSISAAEILSNSSFASLLAPDVTLEGQPALSIGVGFTAAAN